MNCPIESGHTQVLVDYAAGRLDPERKGALEAHLGGCDECRSMAAEQAAVWALLEAWQAPPLSPDFDRRLYRRIGQEARLSWMERCLRTFEPLPLRQGLPLIASACLLLIAGLLMQYPRPLAPSARRPEIVRASQVEKTLDDLDLLRSLGTPDASESVHPNAM